MAIGRKNWLLVGSHEGGEKSAVLMSLVNTCKELGIDPAEYLRDVLLQLDYTPASEVGRLTPRRWQADRDAEQRVKRSRDAVRRAVESLVFLR